MRDNVTNFLIMNGIANWRRIFTVHTNQIIFENILIP